MALISSARTSSSSSFTTPFKHDAFLSFYGKDTRNSFTDHLYNALKEKGIDAFRDNEKLERGTFIAPELMKAIEESKFAIVVLSENYASSRWCLDELVKIVACMEETGLTVLPIFYHVDPSDVRQQTGTYAVAFAEHEKNSKVNTEKIQTWKEALKRVGNIAGWDVKDR